MKNKSDGREGTEGTRRSPGRPPVDEEAATGHIHLRVTAERKAAYVRAARPGKLSAWIVAQLDRAAAEGY